MDIAAHRFRAAFSRHRHTTLLVVIGAVFSVRPLIGDDAVARLVFSLALITMLLVAMYTIQVDELVGERDALLAERRKLGAIGWVLASVAAAERLITMLAPSPALSIVSSVSWLVFSALIAWNELRAVLRQKVVTGETISMSISVYLLFGLTWGILYILIFQLNPHAFNFPARPVLYSEDQFSSAFPALIYFSLTTLTTTGYGDITPLTLQARYAAVAEGVTGQFYLAILVARLVGMQISGSTKSAPDARSRNT